MSHTVPAAVVLSLVLAAAGAQAQIYRCDDGSLYTDRLCNGAAPVKATPNLNLMQAGPRLPPTPEPPAQPALVILPDNRPPPPASTPGSVWDRQGGDDAGFRARTGPLTR